MAKDITTEEFREPRSDVPMQELEQLDNAIDKARDMLDAMVEAASEADATGEIHENYMLHEVMGVGRYAVPRFSGWEPLLAIINDKAADIDFSANNYPLFDDVVAEHFNGAQLSDPLDDEYESYKSLRDNIAAVRNFLMQTYYVNTPAGMTPEKAKEALEQIGAYVGEGLHNNLRLFGVIPNHNPTKPFISISAASEGDGKGAQYLYEKILEMQRHNNWMRPFSAVVALFGGKGNNDWLLPDAEATPFRDHGNVDLHAPAMSHPPTPEELAAMQKHLQALEARRAELRNSAQLTMMAMDMDSIANHLLYTSDNLHNVAHVAEPVRREAIDIAREILRKLKISIGNLTVLDGLKLKPADDLNALGAIKGVAMVYERLIAWAAGIDPTILQHPAVLAATRAVGQLGYLAKVEALRLAKMAGNKALADKLAAQLSRIPPYFSEATDSHFSGLLVKVERGIDTVLNRTPEIKVPNAMVGHKPSKDISAFMSGTPIAGQAMLKSIDGNGAKRDGAGRQAASIIEAQDSAERAQAQRLQAQTAARSRQSSDNQQPTRQTGTGRQQLQKARAAQQKPQAATSTTNPALTSPGMTQAQRLAAMRNAWLAAHSHDHEHDEEHPEKATKAVIDKIDPRIIMGMRNATNISNTASTNPLMANSRMAYNNALRANIQKNVNEQSVPHAPKSEADKLREQQLKAQQQQKPPTKGGRGGPGI